MSFTADKAEMVKTVNEECAGIQALAEAIMKGYECIFEADIGQPQSQTQPTTEKLDDNTGTVIPVSADSIADPKTAELVTQKVKELSDAKQNVTNAQSEFVKAKDEFNQAAIDKDAGTTGQANPTSV